MLRQRSLGRVSLTRDSYAGHVIFFLCSLHVSLPLYEHAATEATNDTRCISSLPCFTFPVLIFSRIIFFILAKDIFYLTVLLGFEEERRYREKCDKPIIYLQCYKVQRARKRITPVVVSRGCNSRIPARMSRREPASRSLAHLNGDPDFSLLVYSFSICDDPEGEEPGDSFSSSFGSRTDIGSPFAFADI